MADVNLSENVQEKLRYGRVVSDLRILLYFMRAQFFVELINVFNETQTVASGMGQQRYDMGTLDICKKWSVM